MKLKTDEEILEFVDSALRRSIARTGDWRDEARELYAFVSGVQWNDVQRAEMETAGKLPVTYNRMDPFLDAVTGLEALNRQECKYLARDVGKGGKQSEVLNAAAKWARETCDAEDEETEAFRDMLICGMGWTNTRLDMETDPDGMLVVERVDPFEMHWDPLSRKKNLADAQFLIRLQRVDKSVIEENWPELAADSDTAMVPDDKPSVVNATEAWKYEDNYSEQHDPNQRHFAEIQWFERERVYYVKMPEGEQRLTLSQWREVKDYVIAQNYQYTYATQRVYKRAFIVGSQVVERQDNPCSESFTYKAITGKRDRKHNTWYGVARPMKSPQQWANKFFSQILFEIVTSGKGIIAELDAFDNMQKAKESWAAADDIVVASPGALAAGKIQPKPSSQIHPGTDRLMQYSIAAFRDVTGINLEMMGLADRQQPGIVEAQRKQSGLTIVAWAFDALRRYRKEQGRLLAYMVREFIADGRLMRIMTQAGAQFIPLIRDDLSFRYDVAVDDAPSSPSMKERTWSVLLQLVPMAMQMGMPVPKEFVEYMPLPESLIEKWKQQMQPQQTPEQQEAAALNKRAAQADVAKKEGEAQLAGAKAQTEMMKAGTDRQRATVEERSINMDNLKKLAEARRTAAETGLLITTGGGNNGGG